MEVAVTDTEDDIREFARITPVDAPGWLDSCAMRGCRTSPCHDPDAVWNDAAELIEDVRAPEHKAAAGVAPAGRATPSRKWPPPDAAVAGRGVWARRGHDAGAFSRFQSAATAVTAAYTAVLRLALRHDRLGAGRPTADRVLARGLPKITPIDEPLVARADRLDRRTKGCQRDDDDGNVLSEANGLMIKLLPHQP